MALTDKIILEKEISCSGFYQNKQGNVDVPEESFPVTAFRRSYESGKAQVNCPFIKSNKCENGTILLYQGQRIRCPYVLTAKSTRLSKEDEKKLSEDLLSNLSDKSIMEKYCLSQRQVSIRRSKLLKKG